MTEKEMIEEICKNFKCCVGCEMFNGYVDCNGNLKNASCVEYPASHCLVCYISTNQAKVLYNAGYRKIPEGSVVLTREEHQKYCAYKIIEPQIRGCLDSERKLEAQLKEARKETAKEILKFVLNMSYFDFDGELIFSISSLRNYITKQYGVEVEE